MEFTVKELAARERVDEKTVRRWIQKGAVEIRRTPGGGIRIMERQDHRRAFFFDRGIAPNLGQE